MELKNFLSLLHTTIVAYSCDAVIPLMNTSWGQRAGNLCGIHSTVTQQDCGMRPFYCHSVTAASNRWFPADKSIFVGVGKARQDFQDTEQNIWEQTH